MAGAKLSEGLPHAAFRAYNVTLLVNSGYFCGMDPLATQSAGVYAACERKCDGKDLSRWRREGGGEGGRETKRETDLLGNRKRDRLVCDTTGSL